MSEPAIEQVTGQMATQTQEVLMRLGNSALFAARALPSVDDAFMVRGVAHPSEEFPHGPFRVSVIAGPIDDEDDPRFEFRVTIRSVAQTVQ